jgi:transcriptional regulator with XRE-family HTH domain
MEYGKIIAKAREGKGWSQRVLGEKIGVTSSTVSLWENGGKQPSLANRAACAEALGIDLDLLAPELGSRSVARTVFASERYIIEMVDLYRQLPLPAQRAANLSLDMFSRMVLVGAAPDSVSA